MNGPAQSSNSLPEGGAADRAAEVRERPAVPSNVPEDDGGTQRDPLPSGDLTSGFAGPLIVALAFLSSIITFLVLMGALGVEPRQPVARAILIFNVLLILALLFLIGRHVLLLRKQSKAGMTGARLQRRVVGLFSLVAAVPTALVASAGLFALERGLKPWFSGDLKTLVTNSESIAQNFQQQLCQNLGRELRLMALDVDRANSSGFFLNNQAGFQQFFNGRAAALGFPQAQIFKPDGSLVLSAEIPHRAFQAPQPSDEDYQFASTEEIPCLISREALGGLIALKSFGGDTYLLGARAVDPRALEFPVVARAGVLQYQTLEERRNATQLGIALVFALITLISLLGAVLLGLGYAARLVDPVRRLMLATDQVSAGNLYVQVPITKMGEDLGQLGSTFNNMTSALREQHNSLSEANDLIDQRRRFMEAMLTGVPAGVLGLDEQSGITLINPTARQILSLPQSDVDGRSVTELLPEIADMLVEARANPQRLTEREFPVMRRGIERILSVRATGDASGGLIVTLDDISNLVTAQRSAAWADVARRIAHEIKNPLTPIQLSAERIRRKFGKVITEDRAIFDQCTDTIVRQVEDIKRMVDEFSSFARMPKPQLVADDLVVVMREVLFMMRVGNPGIVFHDSMPQDPVRARIDRRLIAQATQNLLKNACEAIAESPAGDEGRGEITLCLLDLGEKGSQLDILDNGKGFPREDRQKLLEPYVTTRAGGTGLGLPIVAKIFEDHGGTISLLDRPTSEDGPRQPGALVRIHLPALSSEHSAEASPSIQKSER
ncbi:NtrY Signal transduction histidine kinase involved in nitrogen fixation and metabolism regulation [Rhabdaerophilaceae bacterium]